MTIFSRLAVVTIVQKPALITATLINLGLFSRLTTDARAPIAVFSRLTTIALTATQVRLLAHRALYAILSAWRIGFRRVYSRTGI